MKCSEVLVKAANLSFAKVNFRFSVGFLDSIYLEFSSCLLYCKQLSFKGDTVPIQCFNLIKS